MQRLSAAIVVLAVFTAGGVAAQDLSRHFEGIDGTFVLLNGTTGVYTRHNPTRAAERFAPCSTFKVPNTAILLETGVATGPLHLVEYDPALKITNADWARDHTLKSAFKSSVVWYYIALSRRVGLPAETTFVRQFGYGNQDASGGLDDNPFWLDGTLRISANEQVTFLKRLYEGSLGLSARTIGLMREIMFVEGKSTWRLSGKTGACPAGAAGVTLWYVGYVERPKGTSATDTYYFTLQMSAPTYEPLIGQRVTKARAILEDLGILR